MALYVMAWQMANLPGSNGFVTDELLSFFGRWLTRRQRVLEQLINAGYLVHDEQSARYTIPDWWNYNRPNESISAGQDAYTARFTDDGGSMDVGGACTHSADKVCALCTHIRQDKTGEEPAQVPSALAGSFSNADDARDAPPAAGAAASHAPVRSKIKSEGPHPVRPEVTMTSAERIAQLRKLPKAERMKALMGIEDPGDRDPSALRQQPVAEQVPQEALDALPDFLREHLLAKLEEARSEAADAYTPGKVPEIAQNGHKP